MKEKIPLFLKQPAKPDESKKKPETKKGWGPEMTRTQFLKGMAVAGAALAMGKVGWDAKGWFEGKEAADKKEEPTEEQIEIAEADEKSLMEILDFNKEGPVDLNLGIMEKVRNYWKKQYQENPKLKKSLEDAYYDMGEWEPYFDEIFERHGLPKNISRLLYPESHGKINAYSPAGAAGLFQFMPKTAKSYKLNTGKYEGEVKHIDERYDPLKAAEACAKTIKDLYDASGDWDLALSGYNGGFIWNYLKKAKAENEKPSYKGFLEYIEGKINEKKKELNEMRYFTYRVKREGLRKIAIKLQVDIDVICKENNITNPNIISEGQKLRIPLKEKDTERRYYKEISGFIQNLNYPAKFYAVDEIIQGYEKENRPRKKKISFRWDNAKKTSADIRHVFKKKDKNLHQLARRYKVGLKDVLRANPRLDPRRMSEGAIVTIPNQSQADTLESLAIKNNVPIDRIKKLNPAIRNVRAPLPTGYRIKV